MAFFNTLSTVFYDYVAPNTIDSFLVTWFQSGFGGALPLDLHWIGTTTLIFLGLLLSFAFGGILGIQREINGHAAGLRTHILICIASALLMIVSIYGIPGEQGRDPMRLAAAAVTGVGFLGAGTIIQNGFTVKGLTTAATIWVNMAIGMCLGAGYFAIAFFVCVLTLICLTSVRKIENLMRKKVENIVMVCSVEKNPKKFIETTAVKHRLNVVEIDTSLVRDGERLFARITFKIMKPKAKDVDKFMNVLSETLEPIELKSVN